MDRLKRWALSRRGASIIIAAIFLFAVLISTRLGWTASLILAIVGALTAVSFLASRWDASGVPATPTWARERYSGGSQQMRHDGNATFWTNRQAFLWERRYWFVATGLPPVPFTREEYEAVFCDPSELPRHVVQAGNRNWWRHGDGYFWETYGYPASDLLALIRQRERRHERTLDHARMMLSAEGQPQATNQRGRITRDMQKIVYDRDGGQCVECGSTFNLQYDHIIPVTMGGATTVENLQLLCAACNQSKGGRI